MKDELKGTGVFSGIQMKRDKPEDEAEAKEVKQEASQKATTGSK